VAKEAENLLESQPRVEEMRALLDLLRAHDPKLVELESGDGAVLVCPTLQGRIFCRIENELMHRLDAAVLAAPSPSEFNNLGGNSLWPAPEGGAYGFNYLPGSNRWLVQKGIGETPAKVVHRSRDRVIVEKQIDLTNRKGIRLEVNYRRVVSVPAGRMPTGFGLAGLTYCTEDTFEPIGSYNAADVLLAPWSLEQFPGAEGVDVFCKVLEPETPINVDFYTEPEGRIVYGTGHFTFLLGGRPGTRSAQKTATSPELIGALDSNRSLLILRHTAPQAGIYFNIADNDQPGGPYSAADLYSVFNGGALNFFELETIGAMRVVGQCVTASTLVSETTILKGRMEKLQRYLAERHGLQL